MPIQIETVTVGALDVNCYLVGCPEHKECVVVDPGDSAKRIAEKTESLGWRIAKIVNTHGHADHVGANGKLKELTGAPIEIHANDAPMLTHPEMIDMAQFLGVGGSPAADATFADGDEIAICSCQSLTVMSTPGHTTGSVCLQNGDQMITGDTLFRLSIGRTDLMGGDVEAMRTTLKEKLFPLPDEIIIYPGHGDPSRMGDEKALNPYLRGVF